MIHNLPQTPAFKDERPDSAISEIALRVILEFDGWNLYVLGTATLIASYLAITAKHVVDSVFQKFGRKQDADKNFEIDACAIRLYQALPGPEERRSKEAGRSSSDGDSASPMLGDRAIGVCGKGDRVARSCPHHGAAPLQGCKN